MHFKPAVCGIAFLVAISAGFHVFSVRWIDHFYAINPPHYDSVGSLTIGYLILNAYRQSGLDAAISFLTQNDAYAALSLTQAYFAVLFAPFLASTPSGLQLYNSLATAIALTGIWVFARGSGFSLAGAAMLTLMFFVPDGLWWWDFGLLDYRRDPAMFCLLVGSLFLLVALFTGRFQNTERVAISASLGLCTGLALLSRDTAVIYVVGIIGIPAIALFFCEFRTRGAAKALRDIAPGIVTGLPFVAVFAWWWPTTTRRLGNPLNMFGASERFWTTTTDNILVIPYLLIGMVRDIFYYRSPWLTVALIAAFTVAVTAVALFGRIGFSAKSGDSRHLRPASVLTLAGLWTIVWVHVTVSFVVPSLRTWPFTAVVPPYLPGLIGFYALGAALAVTLHFRLGRKLRVVAVVLGVFVLVVATHMRIAARTYELPPVMRQANLELAELKNANGDTPIFAELWLEVVQIPMIQNRSIQLGQVPPQRMKFVFEGAGYDPVIGVPADADFARRLLAAMREAALCTADFVVVTSDLSAYENPQSPLLLFRSGRPVIEELFAKVGNRIVARFETAGQPPVLVLDNRTQPACPSKLSDEFRPKSR